MGGTEDDDLTANGEITDEGGRERARPVGGTVTPSNKFSSARCAKVLN